MEVKSCAGRYSRVLARMSASKLISELLHCSAYLLDNAIDASLSCDEPYIDCNFSLIRGGNADLISIANSCKSSPLGHDGKLHSRKQDTGFHGYGLKSVKRIADKYNGLLNYVYSEEKHEFRVVVMLEHP